MGKQVKQKTLSSVVKKTGKVKAKPSLTPKKGEKKQVETSVPADLRQPKEPDPKEAWAQRISAELQTIKDNGLNAASIANIAARLSDTISFGNDFYNRWTKAFPKRWKQRCETYDAIFEDSEGSVSVETRIEQLFEEHDNNWDSIIRHIADIFDLDNLEDESPPRRWTIRSIGIQIARQDPFSFFKINRVNQVRPDSHNTLYWYPDEDGEMQLRHTTPLVAFWIIIVRLFRHPWSTTFNQTLGTVQQVPINVASVLSSLEHEYELYEGQKDEDDSDHDDDSENDGMGLPFHSPTRSSTEEQSRASESHSDRPSWHSQKHAPAKVLLATPPRVQQHTQHSKLADLTKPRKKEVRIADDTSPSGSVVATTDEETMSEITGTTGTPDKDSNNASRAQPYKSALERETLSNTPNPKTSTSPIHGRKVKLVQMNMEGIPGQGRIFDINLALTFAGSDGDTNQLLESWVDHVKDTLCEALDNGKPMYDLKVLPIDDSEYRDVSLWLRSPEQVKQTITSYRTLSRYLDMNYGNSPYFTSSFKPGEKKLRTRIRFGFASGDPARVRQFLHTGIQHQGRATGCYETPLQFSPIDKAGFVCFWPEDINISSMENELMRHFDYTVPIGLKMDWVSMPYIGRTKFDERAPGTRLFHLFTRRRNVKEVDRQCRQWLVPSTPIADLPWCAKSHYVHDWSSARNDLLSVKPHALVKDLILTMVNKAQDFQDLTVVLYPAARIHGMLKTVVTRMYGRCSFLKLWHSIKCTPRQAELAEEGKQDEQSSTNSDTSDNEGFRTVRVSKKKKKNRRGDQASDPSLLTDSLEELKQQLSAQERAHQAAAEKMLRDTQNNTPCKLFIGVFPGEMEGTFAFVCRRKFETLAKNVLRDMVPFFDYHLREPNQAHTDKLLRTWISMSDIQSARNRNLQWNPYTLSARPSDGNGQNLDDGLDFLDGFGDDPMDVFDGTLTIDMMIANSKDIDDGATVAGAMEDLRKTEEQLQEAFTEIEVQGQRLEATSVQQAEKESELDLVKRKNEEMQAQIEQLMQQQKLQSEPTQPMEEEGTPSPARRQTKHQQKQTALSSPSELPPAQHISPDAQRDSRNGSPSSSTAASTTSSRSKRSNPPLHSFFSKKTVPHASPPRDDLPAAEGP